MYHELWNASIVLWVFGLIAACASAALRCHAHRNEPYRARTEARVVDIVAVPREGEASLSEFHHRLAAVFEFYADGKPVKITDPSNTYPCPYRIHDRVLICYDPGDPEKFVIIRKNKWELLASLCNILCVTLVLGGCALFLAYAGRNRIKI